MFGSLIVHRTALQEKMIVACSRLLVVIISGDLVLRYFRVLRQVAGSHAVHH